MSLDSAMKSLVMSLPFADKAARRVDGWMSTLSTLGTGLVDRTRSMVPSTYFALPDMVLSDMFHGDAIARQVVAENAGDELAVLANARLADGPAYPVDGSKAL